MSNNFVSLIVLSLIISVSGCGGSNQYSTAPVSGKLTVDGKPVTEGELQFIPKASGDTESGKPGSATVQPDGTFVVSTYGDGDGAVVGQHTIEYVAPPPRPANGSGDSSPHSGHQTEPSKNVPSPFDGMVVQQNTFEVKSGDNVLELNLMK